MKMQRSNCEAGNVQFVQELAEVDGPFEAPININFRDLTKLELPALVWNRSDSCPRKMKITNTGHTVIISAKWKCERPYLTGGPLMGKYVFSQIHFHWGQTDCRGSEHQICGEQFPLEMHVAHFKTDYVTQESALREKDGMVVIVYLFKLQEEPNHSLKKIINSLPRIKQPSTSFAIDPRPIVSFCHPFTEDYFMYWGSVVTSTCAHILLWIICREPFGISKEQVSEFRKIMDSSQQPICKNSRDIQPLHKRNVFHVNASKHLSNPLLPIKKRLGCYCKETNDCNEPFKHRESCHCQGAFQNQEDVEGSFPEPSNFEGTQTGHSCFVNQTFVVQTATLGSLSMALKRSGSDPIKNHSPFVKLKKVKSEIHNKQVKLMPKSCCFFPPLESKKKDNLNKKQKVGEKTKLFQSMKGFSQVMHSLEVLKNQTFKKLKKIESINQEIKEMKPFCQDKEDKRWIRKIEKMIIKEKQFTIKSSQDCMTELRKLAKRCNLDSFDPKPLPPGTNNKQKYLNDSTTRTAPHEPFYDNGGIRGVGNQSSKHSDIGKIINFTSEAQTLIQSFFEDIKDTDDLEETMIKDPNYEKIKSLCSLVGDSKSVSPKNKNYITQKMFNLGNLGDRFFTEITTDEINNDENWMYDMQNVCETKLTSEYCESEKMSENYNENKPENEVNNSKNQAFDNLILEEPLLIDVEYQTLSLKKTSKKIYLKKSISDHEAKFYGDADENLSPTAKKVISRQNSSLNFSTDSTYDKKAPKYKKSKRKSSLVFKLSSKKISSKTSLRRFENIPLPKKHLKSKKNKNLYDLKPNDKKLEAETSITSLKEFRTEEFKNRLNPEKRSQTARLAKEEVAYKIDRNLNFALMKPRTPVADASKSVLKNLQNRESKQTYLKESFSEEHQSVNFESTENESSNVTLKPISVDEKPGALVELENKQCHVWYKTARLIGEVPKPSLVSNCRSLTNLSVKPKVELSQRLQLESIDSRKKANIDPFAEVLKESYKNVKELAQVASNETHKNLNEDKERREVIKEIENLEKWSKSQDPFESDLGFSNETLSQVNDEFLPQVTNEKSRVPRKYQYLEGTEEPIKILRSADSDKPLARNSLKKDDNKNFQTSVSCSTINKNSTSRPHSAETLQSLKKTQKRKGKKRPHCSKRNSKHYIRKNYSVFKKPSKPFNFLNLTDEEQLKIISVNVAKYIKQKLLERKNSPVRVENITTEIENEFKKLSVLEKKPEEPPPQDSSVLSVNPPKTKKKGIPVLKSKKRTKGKENDIKNLNKPNTEECQSIKMKPKIELSPPQKPVNNFIKLNKQRASLYRRSTITPTKPTLIPIPTATTRAVLKKVESKLKVKSNTGTKPATKISKPKAKIQKKTKEKLPDKKPPAASPETQISPPTVKPPTPKDDVQKEKKKKGLVFKKLGTDPKGNNKPPTPPVKSEKPDKDVEVKSKQNGERAVSPTKTHKEIPKPKKFSLPTCGTESDPVTTTEEPNISDKKNTECEEIKPDSKDFVEKIKSEALFKKELEYFIAMQMYLNSGLSTDFETPLDCFGSNILNSGNSIGEELFTKDSLPNLDKAVVVVKNNLEESSSSCSQLTAPMSEFSQKKDSTDVKDTVSQNNNDNDILPSTKPQNIYVCDRLNPVQIREGSEDSPSDSSYDCKISITLNTVLNPKESEMENDSQGGETYCLKENCNSQTTTSLEETSSHVTDVKTEATKKDSEMSMKMKQKLLEILEGEIKREMDLGCSSGNSSDGLGLKMKESEVNIRSQSTESSTDNIETLAQLSTTMRQYLTYLRDLKELPNDSKDYGEF